MMGAPPVGGGIQIPGRAEANGLAALVDLKTVESPQLQSIMVVDIPVMAQLQIPLGLLPLRFPSCSTLIRCSMSLLRRSSKFVRCRGRQSRPHYCSSFLLDSCCMTVVCNDR